jgi:hypothetical protein
MGSRLTGVVTGFFLACGMTGLAAGYAIGIVGDAVRRCLALMTPYHSWRTIIRLTLKSIYDYSASGLIFTNRGCLFRWS